MEPTEQSPQTQHESTVSSHPQTRAHGHAGYYVGALVLLVAGLGAGYVAHMMTTRNETPAMDQRATSNEIMLPSDAKKIEECSQHQGTLYIRPQDIPQGPVYMVHGGKVVGLEYMIPKEQITANQSINFLNGDNIKVDHVNIAPEPGGHAGYSTPHYHVELYTIDEKTQMDITCPDGGSSMDMSGTGAMDGMQPSGSDSGEKTTNSMSPMASPSASQSMPQ